MGRKPNPDAVRWQEGLEPSEQAELEAIESELLRLKNRKDELTYRRIKIVARCRARAMAAVDKANREELRQLRQQLTDGRKLTF